MFLGKEKLKKIESEGVKRKLMGVHIETNYISLTGSLDIMSDDGKIMEIFDQHVIHLILKKL